MDYARKVCANFRCKLCDGFNSYTGFFSEPRLTVTQCAKCGQQLFIKFNGYSVSVNGSEKGITYDDVQGCCEGVKR